MIWLILPSHQTPKWPISKTVSSPGSVKTIVFLSYRLRGDSFPFSSDILIPFGDGFCPRPTQNFASFWKVWRKIDFIDQLASFVFATFENLGLNFEKHSWVQFYEKLWKALVLKALVQSHLVQRHHNWSSVSTKFEHQQWRCCLIAQREFPLSLQSSVVWESPSSSGSQHFQSQQRTHRTRLRTIWCRELFFLPAMSKWCPCCGIFSRLRCCHVRLWFWSHLLDWVCGNCRRKNTLLALRHRNWILWWTKFSSQRRKHRQTLRDATQTDGWCACRNIFEQLQNELLKNDNVQNYATKDFWFVFHWVEWTLKLRCCHVCRIATVIKPLSIRAINNQIKNWFRWKSTVNGFYELFFLYFHWKCFAPWKWKPWTLKHNEWAEH